MLLNEIVWPVHTVEDPEIADGELLMVMVVVVVQPDGVIYVTADVPGATPVTTPVAEPIVAIAGTAEIHVPPVTGLLSDELAPTHSVVIPVMNDGLLIVSVTTLAQPVISV